MNVYEISFQNYQNRPLSLVSNRCIFVLFSNKSIILSLHEKRHELKSSSEQEIIKLLPLEINPKLDNSSLIQLARSLSPLCQTHREL
jgi:hypothetical protein